MAKKKDNLKGLGVEELKKKLSASRESLRVLRFKSEGSKSKNVKEVSSIRKSIARVLTEMNKNNTKVKK